MSEGQALLPGTLELLILQALREESLHGYGIAQRLKARSRAVLAVGESSLYPALQRLLRKGWVRAAWKESETKRRARYYTLTARGRTALDEERAAYARMAGAIQRVLAWEE